MADTKVSALTAVSSVTGTQEFPANDGGVSKKATAAQIKTYVNTAPSFAAGSASAGSWPVLASGTLLTTAEAGAIERDADVFYATPDAGNRGVLLAIMAVPQILVGEMQSLKAEVARPRVKKGRAVKKQDGSFEVEAVEA